MLRSGERSRRSWARTLNGAIGALARVRRRRTERSAWDEARALPLPDATFDLLAEAYALSTELNSHIDIVDASRARGLPAPTVFDHDHRKQLHDSAVDASHRAADEAHTAFAAARGAFE